MMNSNARFCNLFFNERFNLLEIEINGKIYSDAVVVYDTVVFT